MLGHAEQGILHRRQFLEPDETAVEGAAAFEVGDVDAHLDPPVGLRRRAALVKDPGGFTLELVIVPGAPAIADILERRRRVAGRLEARDDGRLVGEEQGEQADAGRIVHRPEAIPASLLQAGRELDLAAADAEQDHLLAAAEVDGLQRLQRQDLVVEIDHLGALLRREAPIDVHRPLREHRPRRRHAGRLGGRHARRQERGDEQRGLEWLMHDLLNVYFGSAKAIRDWLLSGFPSGPRAPAPPAATTATYCRPSLPR